MDTRESMDDYWDAVVECEHAIALPIGMERRTEREWPHAQEIQ